MGESNRIFPSWVLTAVVTVFTILLVSYLRNGNAPAQAKTQVSAAKPPATTPASSSPASHPADAQPLLTDRAKSSNSLDRQVEISGLRIGVDPQHKSQLQYVVVNHSGAQLTGVKLHIKVTSTSPANKGVLFQVSAIVPSLGPNQSKEIRTDIEGQLQSKPIPDWRYLKTEVQVNGQ